LSRWWRTKTRVTTPSAMEVFSAVQGTRYPVSSLPKPIQEAGALTSLRLRGMEWKLG
jgi:hypothetical protein